MKHLTNQAQPVVGGGMRPIKILYVLIALGMFPALNGYGQSIGPATLNAAGGGVATSTGVYDWSVGEMTMVSTFTTPGIVVTQGLLQPNDASLSTGNFAPLATQLKIFPNPATSEVTLEYSSAVSGKLSYTLMDVTGKVITAGTATVAQGVTSQKINVSGLAAATYMLEVVADPVNGNPGKAAYKIEKLK